MGRPFRFVFVLLIAVAAGAGANELLLHRQLAELQPPALIPHPPLSPPPPNIAGAAP
jgi:hypothetical protein